MYQQPRKETTYSSLRLFEFKVQKPIQKAALWRSSLYQVLSFHQSTTICPHSGSTIKDNLTSIKKSQPRLKDRKDHVHKGVSVYPFHHRYRCYHYRYRWCRLTHIVE